MSDQCVGEIRMFAGNYAPEGWALCDGSSIPVSGNEALFSLIGVTYGGDGTSTFALPDLRGRLPVGVGKSPQGTSYALAQKTGSETVTLTAAQIPAHTHTLMASADPATIEAPAGANLSASVNQSGGSNQDAFYLQTGAPTVKVSTLNTGAVSTVGGQPHSNIMPCTAVNFIIALTGVYPDFN